MAAGPLGAKTTALEALQGAELAGKTALVTGWCVSMMQPSPARDRGKCVWCKLGRRSRGRRLPPASPLFPPSAGGNSGIGVETVRALAAAGADVILCSRSLPAGEAVAAELAADERTKARRELSFELCPPFCLHAGACPARPQGNPTDALAARVCASLSLSPLSPLQGKISAKQLDLADLSSVAALAADLAASVPK